MTRVAGARLAAADRDGGIAFNLALQRRGKIPFARTLLTAIPAVGFAEINLAVRRGVEIAPATGTLTNGGKQLRSARHLPRLDGCLRPVIRIQSDGIC